MKFRVRHAERIVGLFILVAAIALCGSIVLIGANQRWFSRNYRFSTRFLSASGVAPGTAVYMKGFQIGKIERITLNEENEVDATFVIYDTYYPKARKNSLLELVTSPIGLGTQLLFHPGKSEELLPEGSFVPLASSEEGQNLIEEELVEIPPKDDTITRLLAGINPLIESVGKTVVTVNRTLTEVNRALAGQSSGPAGRIVSEAASAVATLGQVADNVQAMTAEMRDPTGLVQKLVDPKGSLKTLLDDDNVLFDKLTASLAQTEAALKNLQGISQDLRAQMPAIGVTLNESRVAIKQAQDVLEGLKNNPLLKGGIPQRREAEPLYESLREGQF
jgi:phospholipid/cholesterol/gamma-HCH transport system substrate-binding protein